MILQEPQATQDIVHWEALAEPAGKGLDALHSAPSDAAALRGPR